jgi:hypothetical protein
MVSSLGIITDRKQPILDREPNSFFDQGSCHARNAGSMGALPNKLFKEADSRERERDRNSVRFCFFRGHRVTLPRDR